MPRGDRFVPRPQHCVNQPTELAELVAHMKHEYDWWQQNKAGGRGASAKNANAKWKFEQAMARVVEMAGVIANPSPIEKLVKSPDPDREAIHFIRDEMRRRIAETLARGVPVNLTCNGEVIHTFHPPRGPGEVRPQPTPAPPKERWVMCGHCQRWNRMVDGNHHPYCKNCGDDDCFIWGDERDHNPDP